MDQFRACGPGAHQTHGTFHHVPELRDFIDVPLPHQGGDLEHAGVALGGPAHAVLFAVEPHGADFPDEEPFPVPADPDLPVEDRTFAFQLDPQTEDAQQGHGHEEAASSADEIDGALPMIGSTGLTAAEVSGGARAGAVPVPDSCSGINGRAGGFVPGASFALASAGRGGGRIQQTRPIHNRLAHRRRLSCES